MQERQIYYQEGAEDYSYANGIYNNIPVMRDVNNFNSYLSGPLSFVNYFNQWGPRRIVAVGDVRVDRNIQLLAIPNSIFPKKITSMSQVPPNAVQTTTTYLSLNTSGTFQGDKFRWFGTLQQIRIPECKSLKRILGDTNWLSGGYYVPQTNMIAADPNARVGDNAQNAVIKSEKIVNRRILGSQSTTMFDATINPINSTTFTPGPNQDQYTLTLSNQTTIPQTNALYNVREYYLKWDETSDQPVSESKSYNDLKFPLLLSPQFKPWICFRLITLKFKVSMNEWFQMAGELPYRLNTMFWNKQNNQWNLPSTIYDQWDRATSNSILAKPNPYGGTFKICKNKKIFVNPFKGKTITNWIYSKKRGKIINAKMWQPGQSPIAGLEDPQYAQYGYYSNGLYVSLLLAPLNLERDFDSFTATVLRSYFPAVNGTQETMTKGEFYYKLDLDNNNNPVYYERRMLGVNIPGFPQFTANLEIPFGIQLYGDDDILVKTQTKYCEY